MLTSLDLQISSFRAKRVSGITGGLSGARCLCTVNASGFDSR
jgi:hypothetical protein